MWRPCGVIDDTYEKDLAIIRTPLQWTLTIAGLTALFLMPYWVSGVVLNTVNLIAITVVSLLGVNILTGLTGQITIGQSSFMAVGAYTMVMLVKYWGFSFWTATPIAMIFTGVIGIIVGLPSLRIKGFYLALATVAAQFIIPWLIVNVRPDLTGGTDTLSVSAPKIGEFVFNTQQGIFYICMSVAVFAAFFSRNLQRSRFGRAFVAIRDNDLAAGIMGINVFKYKLMSFFLCSIYAGLAGALYAIWTRGISVDHFTLHESIWYLGMLIVGGLGSVPGVVFGAILICSLNILVTYIGPLVSGMFPADVGTAIELGIGPIVFGVVVLAFLIFEPKGLARIWERFKSYYRLWPFSF
ncbi:MAG: branched-chain amino acid ABC transporter permease [Spirochaetota bacterium]|nr:branched-chain amino acid ABC transporter permease [Spirochaetota bacterium]